MERKHQRSICVIPARGGSKRIPRKNIKLFHGKPIIAYSIEVALQSNLFDRVIVSTDDLEIAAISKRYNAEVPEIRSEKNSGDYATLADVMEEVLEGFKDSHQYACCILPTAPLLTAESINAGFERMVKHDFLTLRPIVKYSYPIQRALVLDEKGNVEFANKEFAMKRSQDLGNRYHDAGMFYWMTTKYGLVPEKRGAIILNTSQVQDIDDESDWELAELKYSNLKGQ